MEQDVSSYLARELQLRVDGDSVTDARSMIVEGVETATRRQNGCDGLTRTGCSLVVRVSWVG